MFQINFLHLLNFIQKTEKMRKLILQFFEIIFSLLIPVTISANPDYDFTQINFDRGIPSRVSYVYEDNNSLIWMSTYEGLLRYDGKRLKSYHFDSGNNQMASNIEILQIMEDEKQQLWVLTNQGVFLYSAKHDKFTPYTWKNQLLQATSACKIDDGIIFGGTDTLYHYSYGQGEITKSEHLKTKNFQVLQLKLWNSHILVCSNRNRTVLFYDLKEQKEFSLPIDQSNKMSDICFDPDGNLWVSEYNEGIRKISRDGHTLAHYTTKNSDLSNNLVLCMTVIDGKI